ncbi:hypothetical protein L917_08846 [Phytophthora nicotianae]|uniref:Uncharacterized protein n=1 Tax=Phytophthora nicotianae TaxID=4792 RepID=W2L6B2_PHYNI|nr:hypothetical protein L915_21747 [Phytophthora nicotianae]ETL92907.1 hypothetical protein L917_08846 [Phytophthora nicotianae]
MFGAFAHQTPTISNLEDESLIVVGKYARLAAATELLLVTQLRKVLATLVTACDVVVIWPMAWQ